MAFTAARRAPGVQQPSRFARVNGPAMSRNDRSRWRARPHERRASSTSGAIGTMGARHELRKFAGVDAFGLLHDRCVKRAKVRLDLLEVLCAAIGIGVSCFVAAFRPVGTSQEIRRSSLGKRLPATVSAPVHFAPSSADARACQFRAMGATCASFQS